jgi:hypothetical protein
LYLLSLPSRCGNKRNNRNKRYKRTETRARGCKSEINVARNIVKNCHFVPLFFTAKRVSAKAANLSSAMPYDCRRPVWRSVAVKHKTATRSGDSCAKRRQERKRENLTIDKPKRAISTALHVSDPFRVCASYRFWGSRTPSVGSVDCPTTVFARSGRMRKEGKVPA